MQVFIEKNIAQDRYDLCKQCEHFNKITAICRECGCFMKLKVKFINSVCPINKW